VTGARIATSAYLVSHRQTYLKSANIVFNNLQNSGWIKPKLSSALLLLVGLMAANLAFAGGNLSDFTDCTIGNKAGLIDASCATFTVPLDHDTPDGKSIELRVARLTAQTNKPEPDAFTLIAGGPGQSATESFPSVAYAFRHIRRDRDIILLDQRGTGQSNKLECPKVESEEHSLLFDKLKTEADSKLCHDQLDDDPRFFSTSVAVKDLELLRQALDIEQWNLYGVSYGTRFGLHYLRRYPDSVRTIILDAVVPPEIILGPEIALAAQRSLLRLFDRCENNVGCNESFPNLRNGTLDLLARLKTTPEAIQYEDINTGELRDISFTDRHLAITMRLMSYSAHGNAILPSMLYDAIDKNNFASLARQAQLQISGLDDALAGGMYNAVICTEDTPFIAKDFDRTALEETYLGSELLDAMHSNCHAWNKGVLDEDFKQPVISDKPALVMSGSDDPVTPPAYGERIVKHLSRSLHIVNENQSHMQAALGCVPLLMAEFINTASTEELPLDCLDRLRAPAFFVDANGPLP